MSLIPHAVLFGGDEMLNLTRRWILERAGFVVLTAQRLPDVDHLLEHEWDADLVVLCYSTSDEECLLLLAKVDVLWPGVAKLWVGHRYQNMPESLPRDVIPVRGGPDEFYRVALRSFQRIAAIEN
ncbi:hypothetical protein [Granulicella paludicola]|uniref:hypothetical protein n=1 Tax=Granulicella paludicola TaxID=474951 RepID=UPI0021DFD886|nr:hypothetical protein [Granulicella paludicola]